MGGWCSLGKQFLLATCMLLSGCGKAILYNSLDETEANQMIAVLKQYGISATKTIGKESCSISIGKGDFSTAVDLLESQGYPLPKYQTIGDVFKKSGLVASPTEERVRFMNALSETIAMTLSKIPGVLKARVHVVLPENDPYAEKSNPSSAAVFITYRQDSLVEDYLREIKFLVTNSIEGLEYDKVSVALFPVTLPPLPKAVKNSDTIISVAGISMAEDSAARFFVILGIFSIIIVILLILLAIIWWNSRKKTQQKVSKIENLAEVEDKSDSVTREE